LLALGAAQLLGMPIWSKLGWLLFLTFPCVLLNLGVAFTLSSIGVFVKDIIQITQFLNLALLYSSAVFFSVTSIPEAFWRILKFNPYLQIINETRDVVFWNQSPSLPHVLYAYGVGAVTLAVGSFLFGKLRKGFSDAL
jgi:lipopolysaccharide transport system permease protein